MAHKITMSRMPLDDIRAAVSKVLADFGSGDDKNEIDAWTEISFRVLRELVRTNDASIPHACED